MVLIGVFPASCLQRRHKSHFNFLAAAKRSGSTVAGCQGSLLQSPAPAAAEKSGLERQSGGPPHVLGPCHVSSF